MTKTLTGRSRTGAVALETRALWWAGGGFLLGIILSAAVFRGAPTPLAGSGSIGVLSALAGAGLSAVSFTVSYVRATASSPLTWRRRLPRARGILDISGLAFLHLAICFLFVLIGFSVLQGAFKGLALDGFASCIVVGLVVAVCGYLPYLGAAEVTSYRLSALLAVFLAGGALESMSTATDPRWWQKNFSALGMGDTFSSWTFNITVIVAGLVIVTLADYVTADLRASVSERGDHRVTHITALTSGLVALGVLLVCVGVFPVDRAFIIHNIAATGMVGVFIAIIAELRWAAPGVSAAFLTLSYTGVGAVVLTGLLLFPIGYLSFTAAELVISALIFAWIVVFVRNLGAAMDDQKV